MIQFTAPISPGSSGGALFDDSGNVIGITTSTLTEGQNINLAVHISEAAALYRSWDGSRTEMEDYKPGRGSWTTATPKPTPIPTPKPSPSPEPTATPKPIATARETTKSYNIISEFAPDLKINDVTIRSNGDVFVEWSGGTGPYTVCYQLIDNIFQEDVLHDRFYCVETYDINKTSIVMQLLVPDHLYRIDVMDKMKNRAFIVFHYESGDFTDFDGKYTLIRQKAKKDGVLSYISTFSCSSLTASVKDAFDHA